MIGEDIFDILKFNCGFICFLNYILDFLVFLVCLKVCYRVF